MKTRGIPGLIMTLIFIAFGAISIHAQNLDSTNYRLISPTVGHTAAGITDSTNYSQLLSPYPVGSFTTTSTNYEMTGGTAKFIEANLPDVTCFETNTNSGSTSCTGLPGSDGMQGVCSSPGCYDRAKIEIDAQGNAADTRYAIQISTTSDFSSGNSYIDGTTRFLKSTLTINDFLPKCEWEGTTVTDVCASPNTTWQRYNILGLANNTTYYVRLTAHHGESADADFTQSDWGPSASATTEEPTISLDVDIAPDTVTSTSPPYTIDFGNLVPKILETAGDMAVFKLSTNAINGLEMQIKGANGQLDDGGGNDIPAVNADLDAVNSGYGLRNESTTNSSDNPSSLGTIQVSSSPSDFTDTGAANKVGAPTVSFVELFNSNSLPLLNGITGYEVKAKAGFNDQAGIYSETLTFVATGTF